MSGSADGRVELVRRGLEAYEAGDIETAEQLLDPEVVVYAPAEIVNADTFHGREGWREWSGRWNEVSTS